MGTELQKIELQTPGKDIESYLACVHSIPILTPEQAIDHPLAMLSKKAMLA